MHNPVVIPDEEIKYSLAATPQSNTIIYSSGFQAVKGIHILLQAFKELIDTIPDAKLVITRGLNDPGLTNLINKVGLNLKNVTLLGHLNRDELYRRYAESTIMATPSIWPEPFPNVALESNMLGIPVVASNIGGLSEIVINGETGYLVRAGDAHELFNALMKGLSNKWDRASIHQITYSRFNPKAIVDKFLKYLESIL